MLPGLISRNRTKSVYPLNIQSKVLDSFNNRYKISGEKSKNLYELFVQNEQFTQLKLIWLVSMLKFDLSA